MTLLSTKPPAQDVSRNVWTANDEARLQELLDRRKRIMDEHRSRVFEASGLLPGKFTREEREFLVDALIANAAALRDVLLPFDGRVLP